MKEIPGYPENRLDIHVDEQGNVTYRQNPVFAQYYAPTREEKEEELEDLRDRLELLDLDEPDDVYSDEQPWLRISVAMLRQNDLNSSRFIRHVLRLRLIPFR